MLRGKASFQRVFNQGRALRSVYFNIKIVSKRFGDNCFGIIVSKKISSSAVIRNKIKRQITSIIQEKLPLFKKHHNIVIWAKQPILTIDYPRMKQELINLLNKLNIFHDQNIISPDN